MDTTRASLLVRIRDRGDTAAWRQFDAIYRPMLMQFALARGLDHGGAEDVTQHCMTAIHRHIDGFDYDPAKGRFRGWLRTIVNNRIRDLHQQQRERPAGSSVFAGLAANEASTDALFDRIWYEAHLKHCLRFIRSSVEPSTFQAFQMYAIQERSVDEVCKALGMTASHVYAIKSRLTKKLRETMRELADGED